MTEWHQATITGNEPAAEGLFHLTVDVQGTPLPSAHTLAGQFVKLSLPSLGEGHFAIASAPGDGHHFEFLIKTGTPLCDALQAAPVGSRVRLSLPQGPGFPLDQARGKHVLLFAAGSGISAIRSAIESIRKERDQYRQVTLFFGARTPGAFAYEKERQGPWARDGIRVVRTVSQPGASGWQGLTGYVQEHLGEAQLENAVAMIVGPPTMIQDVTRVLLQRGMDPAHVFVNV